MTHPINYRTGSIASRTIASRLKHVQRLGLIFKIVGKRYVAHQKSSNGWFTVTKECVVVYGANGKASFGGVCWSYSGEGPRALVDLLMACGLSRDAAEVVAFTSPRNDCEGVDWEYIPASGLYSTHVRKDEGKAELLPPNWINRKVG